MIGYIHTNKSHISELEEKISLIILRDDYIEGYEAMVANQMLGFIDIITTFSHLDKSFLVFCYSYCVCCSTVTHSDVNFDFENTRSAVILSRMLFVMTFMVIQSM